MKNPPNTHTTNNDTLYSTYQLAISINICCLQKRANFHMEDIKLLNWAYLTVFQKLTCAFSIIRRSQSIPLDCFLGLERINSQKQFSEFGIM